ncbi:MAG: exodeoxyribonuclease III [Clostridiales bacterium]|nr:exodeoxyribonuclease III [Clostridiales bacterium]MBQ5968311.1 exodeoxyribonuclease III [Clostridiales bacterium]MBQ6270905.1 exodeoxyribonuclease III [Clostridiales bacterium]MBR4009565.1 exodeoxyribonuclease III [Clostridiales bacterium]
MRLISWNVNGIRAVAKKGFLDTVKALDPDVLCIQETKASVDQLDDSLLNIPGYKSYFSSAERKGYSGTCVYTKREPVSVSYGLGTDEFDHEGRTIELDFGDFILYNIYFPNGGRGPEIVEFKLRFYDCFLAKVKKQMDEGRMVLVCGDVNTAHKEIDLSNPKANSKISGFLPEERVYMDHFAETGLVDTFRMLYPDKTEKYTWWSYKTFARDRNVGWRIDYFFVDEAHKDRIAESEMMSDIMGSDHCPIYIDLK